MGAFAAVRAYAIRPNIFTVYSLGIRSLLVSFRFSPTIVGCIAYALHVSEHEMMVANKTSSFNGRVRRCEGVCDTPLHIYHLFVRDSFIVSIIIFWFSPTTVGAYCIRPDVSENEMIAANKATSFNRRVRRHGGCMPLRPYIEGGWYYYLCYSLVVRFISLGYY